VHPPRGRSMTQADTVVSGDCNGMGTVSERVLGAQAPRLSQTAGLIVRGREHCPLILLRGYMWQSCWAKASRWRMHSARTIASCTQAARRCVIATRHVVAARFTTWS